MIKEQKTFTRPDADGYYGNFGGAYIPEMLASECGRIAANVTWRSYMMNPFKRNFSELLKDYAGRPTPLYYAERLSESIQCTTIYLKREDLCHTGAHKINNTIGQILLANDWVRKGSLLKQVPVSME